MVGGGSHPFTIGFAMHYGAATGLGWEQIARRAVLHSATIIGVDIVSMSADALPPAVLARLDPAAYQRNDFDLSRSTLRFGQQLGVHLHVTRWLALFADREIDDDRAWHVDAGIALGTHRRMK
jgi:hypothetical protein